MVYTSSYMYQGCSVAPLLTFRAAVHVGSYKTHKHTRKQYKLEHSQGSSNRCFAVAYTLAFLSSFPSAKALGSATTIVRSEIKTASTEEKAFTMQKTGTFCAKAV